MSPTLLPLAVTTLVFMSMSCFSFLVQSLPPPLTQPPQPLLTAVSQLFIYESVPIKLVRERKVPYDSTPIYNLMNKINYTENKLHFKKEKKF